MIFNIVTGNKDDHAKNFSFVYESGNWKLSPAYDLVPNSGFNNNHSSTVAGKGNPSLDDIYEVAKQCGLKLKLAKEIFEEVYDSSNEIRVDEWR
jgi:serine/threonine-protein kinase HipA